MVLRSIVEHRATLLDGVPTAYYYLLAHPDFDAYDLSSLTRCWVGGQTLPAAKSLEFTERTGCPVHEVWGMTELAGVDQREPCDRPQQAGHDRRSRIPATRCASSTSRTRRARCRSASAAS